MNFLSKLLLTDPKKYPPKIKVVIFCVLMFSISSFFIWLAAATFIRGSENLQDLTHVQGKLKNSRIMRIKQERRFRTYYEDVLVIRIDNCDDEFGFKEYNKFYSDLMRVVNSQDRPFIEIYYDKNRTRIEQNVTLHTFDMTINGEKYISIDEVKRTEFTGTIICSTIALLLLSFTYWGSKKIIRRGVIA